MNEVTRKLAAAAMAAHDADRLRGIVAELRSDVKVYREALARAEAELVEYRSADTSGLGDRIAQLINERDEARLGVGSGRNELAEVRGQVETLSAELVCVGRDRDQWRDRAVKAEAAHDRADGARRRAEAREKEAVERARSLHIGVDVAGGPDALVDAPTGGHPPVEELTAHEASGGWWRVHYESPLSGEEVEDTLRVESEWNVTFVDGVKQPPVRTGCLIMTTGNGGTARIVHPERYGGIVWTKGKWTPIDGPVREVAPPASEPSERERLLDEAVSARRQARAYERPGLTMESPEAPGEYDASMQLWLRACAYLDHIIADEASRG